ncbi:MAG: hypothetical protein HZB16_02060 [Armatimonadetes bacterium]|nr:hypothetical protein [Armatimonadota bacterium]
MSVAVLLALALSAGLPADLQGWQWQQQDRLGRLTGACAGGQELADLLADPEYRLALAQTELLRVCRAVDLQKMRALPNGEAFATWLLGDADLIEGLLASGPVGDMGKSVYTLYCLWQVDPELRLPLSTDPPPSPEQAAVAAAKPATTCPAWLRNMALGFALLNQGAYEPGKMASAGTVERYRFYRRSVAGGIMHPMFFALQPWEMRWTLDLRAGDDVEYISRQRDSRKGDYAGACWEVAYLGYNQFGDTIQGPLYHMPWRHAVPEGEIWKRTGGVCGTLSTYGSRSANLHGIPSRTAGQPGHCAYAIRFERGKWDIAYYVDWPTSLGTFWGGSWTHMALMEAIYDRDAEQRRAMQHTWQAHLSQPQITWGDAQWQFYEVQSNSFPDLSKLQPTRAGVMSGFGVGSLATGGGGFAAVLNGQLHVSRGGKLRISVNADDGARLYLGTELVAQTGKPATVRDIPAGSYPYRIEYHDIGGARSLDVKIEPVNVGKAEVLAYEQALSVLPTHYTVWREYGARMQSDETVTPDTWLSLSERCAKALVDHQEAAWQWQMDYPASRLQDGTQQAKKGWLLDLHRILRQDAAARFEAYPYDGILNRQADYLKTDKAGLVAFARSLLPIHAVAGDDYLNRTITWAKNRFPNDAGVMMQLALGMASAFQAAGRGVDGTRGWFEQAITAAEQAGDAKSFAMASDLADQLIKRDPVADRQLNAQQARDWPALEAFPGRLVSADGVLRLSSAKYDTPLLHRACLRDVPGGGFFHTDSEKAPTATVVLPGPAVLSGLVLVNRYESNTGRQIPLKVSCSEDDKTWRELATLTTDQKVWRVDLQATAPRARYVRLTADHGERSEFFHLRNVLVYGQPLY